MDEVRAGRCLWRIGVAQVFISKSHSSSADTLGKQGAPPGSYDVAKSTLNANIATSNFATQNFES